MIKDSKIINSFSAKNIQIGYPYHLCIEPEDKKTAFIMEGRGEKISLHAGCEAKECNGFLQENIDMNNDNIVDDKDIEEYANEICKIDENTLPDANCIDSVKQNIKNAKDSIETKIKISECEGESKTTKVEFKITPKPGTAGKEVKIFERIRKDCVDDLTKHLKKIESPDSDYEVIVKADPLLVWSFATLDAEKTVSYEISKFLDENCRRDLKATAAVNVIVENGIEKPPVLAFPQRFNQENPNLLIENPDLILVSGEFKNIEIKENEIKTTETPLGQPDEIELGDDIDFMDANFEIEINPNPQCRIKTGARRTVLCEKGFKIKDIKVKKKGTGALHRRHEFEEGENERPEIENVDVSPLNRLTGADVGTERQVAINIKI